MMITSKVTVTEHVMCDNVPSSDLLIGEMHGIVG